LEALALVPLADVPLKDALPTVASKVDSRIAVSAGAVNEATLAADECRSIFTSKGVAATDHSPSADGFVPCGTVGPPGGRIAVAGASNWDCGITV
jgi:hypothetical protein